MSPDTMIVVEGTSDHTFQSQVRNRILQALDRVGGRTTAAKVLFIDENGPKGGVDTRCTIVADIPRRPDLSVTHIAESAALAFDGALGALEQSAARDRDRKRALARRPKKYFVAKRLLSPDTTLDAPEFRAQSPRITAGPRAKRVRRRPKE
jgi:hypothetical protein